MDSLAKLANDGIKLIEAEKLLREAVEMLNKVPNNKYCDNYKLCNKIDKFLGKT